MERQKAKQQEYPFPSSLLSLGAAVATAATHAVLPNASSSSRSPSPATWETAGNQNGGVLVEATTAAHTRPPPGL